MRAAAVTRLNAKLNRMELRTEGRGRGEDEWGTREVSVDGTS
jgi:hypothetical protein